MPAVDPALIKPGRDGRVLSRNGELVTVQFDETWSRIVRLSLTGCSSAVNFGREGAERLLAYAHVRKARFAL